MDDVYGEIEFYDFCVEELLFGGEPYDFVYAIPEVRELVERLKHNATDPYWLKRLERADNYLLESLKYLPEDYDEDDPKQPPEKWWWHLKTIKNGKIDRNTPK